MIANFAGPIERNTTAAFPTALSRSEVLLNSMASLPMSKSCFEAWRATLDQLVEKGYLSGFQTNEVGIGIRTDHLTAKGRRYFGPALPERFYSSVAMFGDLSQAGIQVTHTLREPRRRRTSMRFHIQASEPFALMWANGLFTKQCQGDVDRSLISNDGRVAGHAHFEFKNDSWKLEKVLVGEHADKE